MLLWIVVLAGCSTESRVLPKAQGFTPPVACESQSEQNIRYADLGGRQGPAQVSALVLTPNNQDALIAYAFEQSNLPGELVHLNLSNLRLNTSFQLAPIDRALARFSKDAKVVVAAGLNINQPKYRRIQAWNTSTGTVISDSKPALTELDRVNDISISPDDQWVFYADELGADLANLSNDSASVVDLATCFACSQEINAVTFDTTGKLLAFGSRFETYEPKRSWGQIGLRVWDGHDLFHIDVLPPVPNRIFGHDSSFFLLDESPLRIAFDPTNHWIGALMRNNVELRDLTAPDFSRKAQINLPKSSPGVVVFSPSGSILAVGHSQGMTVLRVPDLSLVLDKLGAEVTAIAFSPDGCRLSWGDAEGTIHIINAPTP